MTGRYVSRFGDVYDLVDMGGYVKVTNVYNRTESIMQPDRMRHEISSGFLRKLP